MSSGVTLTAATRQNLLSLQGTADLVATTQNRLATGKKVNSALDNPTNFFTASGLSGRSSDLSALLDGIGNGVQTIQAANTGLTKLQSLTNQLKSTAQQALSSSNAFTTKATTTSTALTGATASNLLSTGATVAAANNAVGSLTNGVPPTAPVTATTTGSVDYKPTASATKLVSGASFTPTTSTRASTTGTTFTAPANAVAGTVTTGNVGTSGTLAANATYTITPNGGSAINVNVLAGDSIDTVIGKINADTSVAASGITAAKSGTTIVFTGNANGTSFTVNGSTAETGLTSATASTGQQAAATQVLTINGTNITISGGNAGATAAANLTAALAAINAANTGGSATGVSAAQGTGADVGKIVLTGPASLASFTVNGVANNTLGFPSGTNPTVINNAVPAASQTIGINGTQITLLGGATQSDAIAAINAQTAVTGVTAAVDTSDPTRIAFTGKSDGSAFTVTSSNPASSGLAATATSSIAATVSGGIYVPTVGTAATMTGATAFTAPANAVRGTATGGAYTTLTGAETLAITSGGNTYNVNLATGTTLAQAVTQINSAIGASGITVAANAGNTALVFSGASSGAAFSVTAGTGTETGFTTSATNSTGQAAAATQTLTIGSTAITISGGTAGTSAAANLTAALAAINAQTTTTGVTASQALGADAGKILLTGLATTGADFSVTGSAGNTLGFATSATSTGTAGAGRTAGVAPASQTLTINGTAVTIAGGSTIDQAITAINNANTGASATGVSAVRDPANTAKIKLTGANTAGTSFTVASSNSASSGFSASPTRAYASAGADQTVTVNGTAVTIKGSATLDEAIAAINAQSNTTGVTAARGTLTNSNKLVFSGRSDGSSFTVQGSADNTLGISSTASTVAGTLDPAATSLVSTIGFQANDNFSVNGQLVTVSAGDTIASLVQKVGAATNGAVNASYDTTTNKFSFTAADSSTAVTLADGSTATSKVANLGFTTTSFASGLGAPGSTSALAGKSLTIQVGSGANIATTSITFGSAPGQISTLTQLNAALAPANAQATIDTTTGKLSISTTNDFGAENLSVTATGTGNPFTTGTLSAVIGGDGLNTRNGLVTNYNNLLTQIDQLAADSGYNGVNLLTGDNLKISFNEKGTSSLSVQGNAVTSSSLGLSAIGSSTFQESSSINKLIDQINSATNTLKSQASSLGSNLAVVQNRQDFSKNLINILDTGAANLTNADLNEEAANSQALSTRQSLGISALSLANQANQGVLQLLR